MGSLTWNTLGGVWNDPSAWSIVSGVDNVPNASVDVTISAPLNYAISVTGVQAAHDVVLNAAGAHVDVTGTLAVHNVTISAGLLALTGTLDVSGTVVLSGGGLGMMGAAVFQGGTVTASGNAFGVAHGTLSSVTVVGPLDESNGTLNVQGGLTLLGPSGSGRGTLQTQDNNGIVNFLDSTTLDNADVISHNMTINADAGTTLTLGSQLYVSPSLGSGITFGGMGALVNYGTIELKVDLGSTTSINNPSFENFGTINLPYYLQRLAVAGSFENSGFYSGFSLYVGTTLSGTGTIRASYVTASEISSGVHITRLGGGTLAVIASSISPQATIDGLAIGGGIDLTGVPFTFNTNAFWSGTPAGGTLTIKDGTTTTATLFLTGISDGATFSVGPDGNATPGVVITTNNAPCFLAGTRIRTPAGDIAVETLVTGNPVVALRAGTAQPVMWVGHRRIETARHADPEAVWPVCIRAHAIAENVPLRDLYLSPEHAVFLNGVLVPARHLINGTSITQERRAVVLYYHVELPRHDLVLAEGMACESFLDMGNRDDFDNAGAVITAHPRFASAHEHWQSDACAPQCRGGSQLAAIRRQIDRRAGIGPPVRQRVSA